MVAEEFPAGATLPQLREPRLRRANNQAMAVARGEFFLLLNSDAELLDDGMARLLNGCGRDRRSALQGSESFGQTAGYRRARAAFPPAPALRRRILAEPRSTPPVIEDLLLGHYWDHAGEREADWVIGACMLVRGEIFRETGGFDPSIFLYGEEVEWCCRIRERGWKVLFSPVGSILHLDHQSAEPAAPRSRPRRPLPDRRGRAHLALGGAAGRRLGAASSHRRGAAAHRRLRASRLARPRRCVWARRAERGAGGVGTLPASLARWGRGSRGLVRTSPETAHASICRSLRRPVTASTVSRSLSAAKTRSTSSRA